MTGNAWRTWSEGRAGARRNELESPTAADHAEPVVSVGTWSQLGRGWRNRPVARPETMAPWPPSPPKRSAGPAGTVDRCRR